MSTGSRRGITAGEAFIRFGADRETLQKDLKAAQRDFRKWANSLNQIGRTLTIGGGAMVGAVAALIPTIANAETAWKRFGLIFGRSASNMQKELRAISRETGLAMTTLVEVSASFGAIFAELRELSGEPAFVKVVGDIVRNTTNLAALAGVSIPEAADKMRSAFTSTGEAVDQYGLELRITQMEQEAMRLGLTKAVRDMTDMEKKLIKLSLINRQFVRTGVQFVDMVDTINGQFTLMIANLKELIVVSGWMVRMVLIPMMRIINKLLIALREMGPLLSPLIVLFGGVGVTALTAGVALLGLAAAIRSLTWAIGVLATVSVSTGWLNFQWFLARSGLVTAMGFAIEYLAFTITTLAAAFRALWASMGLAGPIGVVLTAATAMSKYGGDFASSQAAASASNQNWRSLFVYSLMKQQLRPWTDIRQNMLQGIRQGLGGQTANALTRGTASAGFTSAAGAISGPISQQLTYSTTTGQDATATNTGNIATLLDEVAAGKRSLKVEMAG